MLTVKGVRSQTVAVELPVAVDQPRHERVAAHPLAVLGRDRVRHVVAVVVDPVARVECHHLLVVLVLPAMRDHKHVYRGSTMSPGLSSPPSFNNRVLMRNGNTRRQV